MFLKVLTPSATIFKASMSKPESVSSKIDNFGLYAAKDIKKGSKIRFEALDVEGDTLYIEPGVQAGKTFKDGTSIVMAIHIYDDTPIRIGSLQITAELDTYIDNKGIEKQVPIEFRDRPNIRRTQTFNVNAKIPIKTQVRFF